MCHLMPQPYKTGFLIAFILQVIMSTQTVVLQKNSMSRQPCKNINLKETCTEIQVYFRTMLGTQHTQTSVGKNIIQHIFQFVAKKLLLHFPIVICRKFLIVLLPLQSPRCNRYIIKRGTKEKTVEHTHAFIIYKLLCHIVSCNLVPSNKL